MNRSTPSTHTTSNFAAQSVPLKISLRLSVQELTRLYQSFKSAIPNKRSRVIQFVSGYPREGSSRIAFETGYLAAVSFGANVLFVDAAEKHKYKDLKQLMGNTSASFDMVAKNPAHANEAIVKVGESKLYYTSVKASDDNNALIDLAGTQAAIEMMRPHFDLIILNTPGVFGSATGPALSQLADGTIMVVAAESTRRPVVLKVKENIIANGGKVIGAVMNKRRKHIPSLFYYLFLSR
ncbi:MAG: hypothetical protein MK052_09420 [Alphaproteobacteria bacterium]|nr:hypothetical protein [Alphaproteobacteria bacterium]